jgi:intein/homing endonuclease
MVNLANGSYKSIEEIIPGDKVLSYENGHITPTDVTHTHLSHSDKLLHVKLHDGRDIVLTPNHPLRTIYGWEEASNLTVGQSIAVPRKINIQGVRANKNLALILGYMLADGNFRQLTFACDNKYILSDFTQAVESFGLTVNQTAHIPAIEYSIKGLGTGVAHPIRTILDNLGIDKYCVREEKFIPSEIYEWDNENISAFLRALFSGDGCISGGNIIFANLSSDLVIGSQKLLLRFGILSRYWFDELNQIWKLGIYSNTDVHLFLDLIGFTYPVKKPITRTTASLGSIPSSIYDIIAEEKNFSKWGTLARCSGLNIEQARSKRNKLNREWVQRIASTLKSDRLQEIASDEIAWITVDSIEELPGDDVYNISTANHTFIAHDIITHNTEAGLIGTIQNINGTGITTEGAAATFADGLMLIDEFSAITNALKVQYNSQMDTQLLALLDHGKVNKRLGGGKIEYDSNLTLWAGVQPARYDLSAGLGRRMIFLLFLPSRYDNEKLLETMHTTRNIRPDDSGMNTLWGKLHRNLEQINDIESVEFDDSVFRLYQKLRLFSYESSYFDRLLLGCHLAYYGAEKHISVSADLPLISEMIEQEKKWRDTIVTGVDFVQMIKLIKSAGVEIEDKIEITMTDLVNEGIMIGWNAHQIHEKSMDMIKQGMLSKKGGRIIYQVE